MRPFLAAELFAVFISLLYFLNWLSEPAPAKPAEANLFFLGVVIKFSLEDVLSLSVAYVES